MNQVLVQRVRVYTLLAATILLPILPCCTEDGATAKAKAQYPAPDTLWVSYGTHADHIAIGWTSAEDAVSYAVYRSDSSDTGYSLLAGDLTDTAYTDTAVLIGHNYYYRVTATYANGTESDPSDYEPGLAGRRALLLPPAGVIASDGAYTDRVVVSWSRVTGAASYRVYRAAVASGSAAMLGDAVADTAVTDTAADPGTHYLYQVVALDSASGASDLSASDEGFARTQTTAVPTHVQASDGVYPDRVVVSWRPVAGVAGYRVYRASSAGGTYSEVSSLLSDTSYADQTVTPGTAYYYRVRSLGVDSVASDFSATNSGFASAEPPPPAPQNLAAGDGLSADTVAVTWSAVAAAASYTLYRAEVSGGPYVQVATGLTDTLCSDLSAAVNRMYYYRANAVNGSGAAGNPSAEDSGYAFFGFIPTGVTASEGISLDTVLVSWRPVLRATGYEVYRQHQGDTLIELLATLSDTVFADTTVGVGPYKYRVVAVFLAGRRSAPSAWDLGYRLVTNREFLLDYNNTSVYTSQHKMDLLMSKQLGEETVAGTVSGTSKYYARIETIGYATVDISYTNYCDDYLTLNGTYTTVVGWISRDGDLTGTITVSGIYSGTIVYHVTIADEKPAGGYYGVTQTGQTGESITYVSVDGELLY